MKIVVLAGGISTEREVSLASGCLISNALIENEHDVMLVDLYLGIKNKSFECIYRNRKEAYKYEYEISKEEPNLNVLREIKGDNTEIGEGVLEICKDADIVFLALHGGCGENGKIQALLDLYDIKYTGTGYAGSMLAMDKAIAKKLIIDVGVNTANFKELLIDKDDYANSDFDGVKFPAVVKPVDAGSSIGVYMADNKEELINAISKSAKYANRLVIEDRIIGREFSVGILNGIALPPIELIASGDFYDYENKYQDGMTEEICPANISESLDRKLKEEALKAHDALYLGNYSRIDFIADKDENVFFIEANTLPGMTDMSLLPKEAKAIGISYNDLCEMIIKTK